MILGVKRTGTSRTTQEIEILRCRTFRSLSRGVRRNKDSTVNCEEREIRLKIREGIWEKWTCLRLYSTLLKAITLGVVNETLEKISDALNESANKTLWDYGYQRLLNICSKSCVL